MDRLPFKQLAFFGVLALLFSSCVPQRQFQELEAKHLAAQSALADCKDDLALKKEQLEKENLKGEKLEDEVALLEKQISELAKDTTIFNRRYSRLKKEYADLTETLEKQISVNKEMAAESEQKNKKLYGELLALEKKLKEKEDKLNERNENLDELQLSLKEREKKVAELQKMVGERDSTMKQLKAKISEALLSFKDKGISVDIKGDQVYVSLEEEILFASGKYKIDSKVKTALVQLSEVLNNNEDVDIMVEGHTDSDPIKTSCIADNYDLSVLRATEIVRVLTTDGKVNPTRIVAAGRGEHKPVAANDTAEGKKKNRRIEIILTPNLDELYNLLDE